MEEDLKSELLELRPLLESGLNDKTTVDAAVTAFTGALNRAAGLSVPKKKLFWNSNRLFDREMKD